MHLFERHIYDIKEASALLPKCDNVAIRFQDGSDLVYVELEIGSTYFVYYCHCTKLRQLLGCHIINLKIF